MSVGINDNISRLYQLQSEHINHSKTINTTKLTANSSDKELSKAQKAGILVCSVLGVAASLMALAKFDKSKAYTINPLKMFKGKLKDSYMLSTRYKTKEIVTMGIGSILGGLLGGTLFDKKCDFNSKLREGIVQILNISMPIAFVESLSWCGNKGAEKLMPNWWNSKNLLKQGVTRLPATIGAMAGLISGMYIGNRCSNKFNEKVFGVKDNRPMKWKDFSAHVDDIGVAATFIAPDNFVTNTISRLIPMALIVPGYETGVKK